MWGRCTCFVRLLQCHWQKQALLLETRTLRPRATPGAAFHASCVDSHPRSGDRGPEKNYQKKMKKKENRRHQAKDQLTNTQTQALLEGMRQLEAQPTVPKQDSAALKDLLADARVHIPSSVEVRRRLGMPERPQGRGPNGQARYAPQLKGRDNRTTTNFMDPSAGKRLGIFYHPEPGMEVMPPHKPDLAEEDEAKAIESLLWLRPRNQFEVVMEETRFPRHFPIDNEDYETEEHDTGFEDHVLLDHLLEGFPKRGPVRHFMELVVTGLSKNSNYSAQEKREYVEWYKEYFSRFTPEELQAVMATKQEPQLL